MWFGLQCYAGSLACLILIGKILAGIFDSRWRFHAVRPFSTGINYFLTLLAGYVGIGFGGGKVLNKFTAILNPCIYIVFGGMAIWAISLVGIGPIFDYIPGGIQKAENSWLPVSGGDKRGGCGLGGTGGERIRLYAKTPTRFVSRRWGKRWV